MGHPIHSVLSGLLPGCLLVLVVYLGVQGCATHQYTPVAVDTGGLLNEINTWVMDDAGLNRFLTDNGFSTEQLSGNRFSIKRIFLTGLYFDPELRVALKKWRREKIAFENSDYLINPEFAVPFEYHSDTSDDQSAWTLGGVLSFIYERRGKREARQVQAGVELLNARLQVIKIANDLLGEVEKKYYAYLVDTARLTEAENEISVLKELLNRLEKRYELGAVSQFELSTVKLELQQRQFQLALSKNRVAEKKDDLSSLTYLAHTQLDRISIEYIDPVKFIEERYRDSEYLSATIPAIQKIMLDDNLELILRLNEYALSEAALRLRIEEQYPDLVLSPGLIFDQSDNILTLGAAWVLPLFRNTRQNLEVLKALETRKIKQQRIVALQKDLLRKLYLTHSKIIRFKNAMVISNNILNAIDERADDLYKQLEIGGIDNIALLRNRMEYFKARQMQLKIYADAIKAILKIRMLTQNPHTEININGIIDSRLKAVEDQR